MSLSTPPSKPRSPSRGGGGGPGPGLASGGSVPLTPRSPAASSTSTAAAGAVFAALASCLLPEASTGEADFEKFLQQFTTGASLSGWPTATTDNRP